MKKNRVLFVLGILLSSLLNLSLVSAYYPYYHGYNDNYDNNDMYYNGYYPYYGDNYIEGKKFSYVGYQGYENGPKYVDSIWGFSSMKSSGYTSDGGYQTTRTYMTTSVDYSRYPYMYGYHRFYPRSNYYFDYYPRQQYHYYY